MAFVQPCLWHELLVHYFKRLNELSTWYLEGDGNASILYLVPQRSCVETMCFLKLLLELEEMFAYIFHGLICCLCVQNTEGVVKKMLRSCCFKLWLQQFKHSLVSNLCIAHKC